MRSFRSQCQFDPRQERFLRFGRRSVGLLAWTRWIGPAHTSARRPAKPKNSLFFSIRFSFFLRNSNCTLRTVSFDCVYRFFLPEAFGQGGIALMTRQPYPRSAKYSRGGR